MRITKRAYEALGGMRNSYVYRKQDKRGRWSYHCSDMEMAEISAERIEAKQ
ncbi:MAG: hypothetical protein AAGA36_00110 [Pseudomonadota bacterium]